MAVDILEGALAEQLRPSVVERVRQAREKSSPDPRDVRFGELADEAIASLRNFLKCGEMDSKAIGKARVAASALSAWTRFEQTKGAREATSYMMARDMAANRDELRRYVQVTMPTSPLAKASQLGEGTKE